MTKMDDAARTTDAASTARADAETAALARLAAASASNTGRKIARQVQAWRHNRLRYPGWLIAPWANRLTLWTQTQQWIDPVLAQVPEVEPAERLLWLRELTWRYELCLLPLWPDFARAIESALATVDPFRKGADAQTGTGANSSQREASGQPRTSAGEKPAVLRPTSENLRIHRWADIAEAWLALVRSVLRYHREEGHREAFDSLALRLDELPTHDADLSSFVTYQRCLFALERLEQAEARRLLSHWRDYGSDPFWMVRMAALFAELGDDEAVELAKRGLLAIREIMPRGAAADAENFYSLSCEGWAMNLVWSLLPRGLDFRSRWEELAGVRCDPWPNLERLSSVLDTPLADDTSDRGRRSRFDEFSVVQQAYQARRLIEDAGYPLRFGHLSAGADLLKKAVPWIGLHAIRGTLPLLLRLSDDKAIKGYLRADRVARLADEDTSRAAQLALAGLAEATPYLPTAVHRSHDHDQRSGAEDAEVGRRDVIHDQAKAALQILKSLTPRLENALLDEIVRRALEVRGRWVSGPWQTWAALGSVVRKALEEMAPEHAAAHFLALVRQPLPGVDVRLLPLGMSWTDDPMIGLWNAATPDRNAHEWNEAVGKMIRNLETATLEVTRGQAALRCAILNRAGALRPEEAKQLVHAIWGPGPWPGATATPQARPSTGTSGAVAHAERPFPLPLWFLLALPEPVPGAAASAVKRETLRRPLERFSVRDASGRIVQWRFKARQDTDVLTDVLAATRHPWEDKLERRMPTVEWTVEDAHALLALIEAWWEYEGADLWRHIEEDPGPFDAMMPRWRFISIVEVIAYVVLPARGSECGHLSRAATLVRKMQAAGIVVDLALPVVAVDSADSGECVAAELRMSLASTSVERVAAALPAVHVWLEASWRGLTAPPPSDLVQEIGSIIRGRRAPVLLRALQLAAIVLKQAPREVVDLIFEDVRIGLQYLAEETQYSSVSKSLALQYGDVTLIRQYAAELLAAFARHAEPGDRTIQIWLEGAEREPLRGIRSVLLAVAAVQPAPVP